jgi:tryptophan synthase alpha chain
MNQAIAQAFDAARRAGKAAFIPFLTGGLPDPSGFAELLLALDQAGADLIEVGIPFSDPMADGPVIQKASKQALDAGVTPSGVLEMLAQVSPRLKAPLVVMTYYNPVLSMGLDTFAQRAAAAGVSGVIVPDLTPEEAGPWSQAAAAAGLGAVFMAAPTTPDARLPIILEPCTGFLYYVSMTGVTGAAGLNLDPGLLAGIARARKAALPRPLAVGFGVSTPGQAAALAAVADGVIVGSALVKLVLEAPTPAQGLAQVGELAAGLAKALILES